MPRKRVPRVRAPKTIPRLSEEDRARVEQAEPLARTIVRTRFSGLCPRYTEDLVQEGLLGLAAAIGKYDPSRRFSTFAYMVIHQAIVGAIPRLVDTPVVVTEHARMSPEGPGKRPTERVVALARKAMAGRMDSHLEDPAWEGDPCGPVDDADAFSRVRESLGELNPRHAELLSLRHGLAEDDGLSQRQVAERMGISHQRVGRLECSAMRALRKRFKLKGYTPECFA